MPPRGPKPKSPALKLLEGNPGHRPVNKSEPKLPPRKVNCPSWLNKEAKREWRRIVPKYERLGWVNESYIMALAMLFQSWARWREAEEFIERNGTVRLITEQVKNEATGISERRVVDVVVWPQVAVSLKYGQQCRLLCAEFGLTLSASGRIELPKDAPQGGMEGLLRQQGS